MNTSPETYPMLSIVIVTFNRIQTLRVTVEQLLARIDVPRERVELIISDDGSDPEILRQIQELPYDILVETDGRKGLSANANRGLAAANCDLILQIQDDWELTLEGVKLSEAFAALQENPDVGLLLLNTHPNHELKHALRPCGDQMIRVFENVPDRKINRVGEHAYSDWPHLKTRAFIKHIGAYDEKLPMWDAELDYSRRINAQEKYNVADFQNQTNFKHIGAEYSFNTGSYTTRIKRKLLKYRFFQHLRDAKKHIGPLIGKENSN